MKITELLKLLDKKYGDTSEFKIFEDGSGGIINSDGWIAEWGNEKEMHIRLKYVYKSVSEEDMYFEL